MNSILNLGIICGRNASRHRVFCSVLTNWRKTVFPTLTIPQKLFSSDSSTDNISSDILKYSTQQFLDFMSDEKINRAHVIYDEQKGMPVASHAVLQPVADHIGQSSDFLKHSAVFFSRGLRSNCLLGAFIWRINRGQAYGGVRLWRYKSMDAYLKDGLRLAYGMGVKSALAGLWTGGGHGVIAEPASHQHLLPDFRQKLFWDYGDFLTSLNGCFVAAGDLGLTVQDVNCMFEKSRFVTGVSQDLGGNGDIAIPAGLGVVSAMEGALDYLSMGSLEGKTVVIQGAGSVAGVIIEELLERNVGQVIVSECNQKRLDDVRDKFYSVNDGRLAMVKVELDDLSILEHPCDILSPCALGNVLTSDTIPTIRARIVCGAANNQLGAKSDNQLLMKENIIYVPDFLANRMGLVSAANEPYGRMLDDPAIYRHFDSEWDNSIFVMTKRILKEAAAERVTPAEAAIKLADQLSCEEHPIWPGRGSAIISSLLQNNWYQGNNFLQGRKQLNTPTG